MMTFFGMETIHSAPAAVHLAAIGSTPLKDGVSPIDRTRWLDDAFAKLVNYSTMSFQYDEATQAAFDAGVRGEVWVASPLSSSSTSSSSSSYSSPPSKR